MWTGDIEEPQLPAYLVDDYWTTILKNIDNFDDETGLIKGKPKVVNDQPKDVDPGIELLIKRQEAKNNDGGGGADECLTCMCCICC